MADAYRLSPHAAHYHLTGRHCAPDAMPDLLHELLEHRALESVHATLEREAAARKQNRGKAVPTAIPAATLDWYREIEMGAEDDASGGGEDGEDSAPWGEEWTA